MTHQTNFLSHVLGGPNQYKGRELKAAHKDLNIKDADFAQVADYLEETLDEAGVDDKDIEAIIGIVASVKGEIVS